MVSSDRPEQGIEPGDERNKVEMVSNRPTPDPGSEIAAENAEVFHHGRSEIGHGSVLIAAITSCTNTSNPSVMLAAGLLAKKAVERGLTIDPAIGDEVVKGSTRLSAGTAQKMVLNMISTGVMVRLGRTYGNLMVGVRAANAKLRARARDIVRAVTGASDGIEAALESAGGDVALACVMIARKIDRAEAASLLASSGSLRAALSGSAGR